MCLRPVVPLFLQKIMKKTVILVLLAAVCMGTQAMPRKKEKKGKKEEVARVDTVDVDTFSYLIGHLNTRGLMEFLSRQKGVDTRYIQDFVEGFASETLSEEDLRAKARIAGTEIREDIAKRVIPNISKQMNDTVDLLNHAEFLRGFKDGVMGKPAEIDADSAMKVVDKQMKYYRDNMMESKYGANRRAGEDFLKANQKQKDVNITSSGLQYKVITKGNGPIPEKTQKVRVNYEGRLLDGTIFDSSYQRGQPATFGVNQVIPGWVEALAMMPVGSKWELYIPQELAYGSQDQKSIPPFSCLIFTVELLEIVQ